jgi:flap endonuclease-1
MGVKISDLVKPAVKNITIENLLSKPVAIDAFNSIYQFLATIRQPDGTSLKDLQGNVTSHLSGLFYRTLNLIESDIKPLYVFDGKPHELKLQTIQQRREKREEEKKLMQAAQDAGDLEEAQKHAQATSKLTGDMIEESKSLLTYLGVPWVEAVHDGEGEAARLINSDIVWAAASQDYDSLLFGAKRLIRNLNINRRRKVQNTTVEVPIEFYTIQKVLEALEITQEQLVDIGILVGLDFFEGFKGIGEKTALKMIKENGSIEKIIEKKIVIKGVPIEIDSSLLTQIRDIFLHVQPPQESVEVKWKLPNEVKIRELLVEKHNFSLDRIEPSVKKLINKKTNKSQSSLDNFL